MLCLPSYMINSGFLAFQSTRGTAVDASVSTTTKCLDYLTRHSIVWIVIHEYRFQQPSRCVYTGVLTAGSAWKAIHDYSMTTTMLTTTTTNLQLLCLHYVCACSSHLALFLILYYLLYKYTIAGEGWKRACACVLCTGCWRRYKLW